MSYEGSLSAQNQHLSGSRRELRGLAVSPKSTSEWTQDAAEGQAPNSMRASSPLFTHCHAVTRFLMFPWHTSPGELIMYRRGAITEGEITRALAAAGLQEQFVVRVVCKHIPMPGQVSCGPNSGPGELRGPYSGPGELRGPYSGPGD